MILVFGFLVMGIAVLITFLLLWIGKLLVKKAKESQNELAYKAAIGLRVVFILVAIACIMFALYLMWDIVAFIRDFPG